MISARSGRTDITSILLEEEHTDLDIQDNVSVDFCDVVALASFTLLVYGDHIQLYHDTTEIKWVPWLYIHRMIT